jgi:hypothetical protein
VIYLTPLNANKCGKLAPTRCRNLRDRQSCPPSVPYTPVLASCPYFTEFFFNFGFDSIRIPPNIPNLFDEAEPWRAEIRMQTGGVAGTIRATWSWYDLVDFSPATWGVLALYANGTLLGYKDAQSGSDEPFGIVDAAVDEVLIVGSWNGGDFRNAVVTFSCPVP